MRSEENIGLKREVGWFGSFAMGFGDVGADVFIALGVVTLYAGGASLLAFLIAALVYVMVALAYGELAPTYPYAGGVHVYALRAANTLMSFLAGWAIMLDYIIDISLFATASAGYLKYLFPELKAFSIKTLMGLEISSLGLISAVVVTFLIILNYIGIKYSAGTLSGLVAIGLIIESIILVLGFFTSFNPSLFVSQLTELGNPSKFGEVGYLEFLDIRTNNFLYAITLAMASFVGIESIAQAAEETKRPHKWIPRAVKLCLVAVPLSVISISSLSIGILEWRVLGESYENPVAVLVSRFPVVGRYLSIPVAVAAIVLCLASANTGVIGVSRLTASMGKFNLLPGWLYRIHPKFRTPTRTILIFGLIGLLLTLPGDIPLLATLYNFGASLSYLFLMIGFLMLRNRDREVYRPWRIPFSMKLRIRDRIVEIPLVGLLGLILTSAMWALVILLHPAGRLVGSIWMLAGLLAYMVFRKISRRKLLSREEQDLIVPAGYRMRTAVLIRPFDDRETILKSILRTLDKRFSLKLISVIDLPRKMLDDHGWDRIRALKVEVEEMLASLAKDLESKGFETTYEVKVGDFSESLESEVAKGDVDFIVYIVRGFEKIAIEKGHDEEVHSIMLKHPGKIMLLKRVTE